MIRRRQRRLGGGDDRDAWVLSSAFFASIGGDLLQPHFRPCCRAECGESPKMSDAEEVKVSLNVMMNKQKSKVLFAESDSDFADILLSFLTLPLGRIVKVLEKHYGDEAPTIGSLNNLYHNLANLDSSHFVTEGAKQTLLDSASSFEAEYRMLKVDISDSPPAEYFVCSNCSNKRFRCASIYYDSISCSNCKDRMSKVVVDISDAPGDGLFTKHTSSFIVSNDLHILPKETGFLSTVRILGITVRDMENAETIKVDFGFTEIMKLLKASLTSPTPLSDLILNKTTTAEMNNTPVNTPVVGSQRNQYTRYIGCFSLTLMVQKSTETSSFLPALVQQKYLIAAVHIVLISFREARGFISKDHDPI